MDRSKPPALTSPWKIGFFVSLMLMTVSIGVAYFVARSFGVVWPPLTEWGWEGIFQGDGFAFGLTPIIAMVVLAALSTYFLTTAAVRKYRRYLDSGKDYHHLIQTLNQIEDLDDPRQLSMLDSYDELREFLLGLRHETARRRADLDEREKALESAVTDAGKARQDDVHQRVNEQAQLLATAIARHPGGTFENVAEVTLPSLKRLEDTVRTTLRGAGGANSTSNLGASITDIEESVREIMHELEDTGFAARDIEQELTRMTESGTPGGPNSDELRHGLDSVVRNFDVMDKLSQSLGVLGEEAKGVAINTALQAGAGKISQSDVVQLAEDIKEVASNFKGIARSYHDLTREIRASLTNIEVGLGDMLAGANSYEASAIGHVSDRVGRWVERNMVIVERMRGVLGESSNAPAASPRDGFELSQSPFDTASRRAAVEEEQVPAFETESAAQSAFVAEEATPVFTDEDLSEAAAEEQFESLDESTPILDEASKTAVPELDGIQNEERSIFDEMSTQDEMFAELGADERRPRSDDAPAPVNDGFESAESPQAQPAVEDAWEAAKEAAWERPQGDEAPPEPVAEDAPEAVNDVSDFLPGSTYDIGTSDEAIVDELLDDDVIDLYALGAVDYDPAVHQ